MSDTQAVSEGFPEDDLPGTGLFFDAAANEPDPAAPAAAEVGPAAEDEGPSAHARGDEPQTDDAEAQPIRRDTGLDFEVTASEAAAMMTERLGRKTTTATFRRLVIDGAAPEMVDPEDDSPRWSQIALDAWLDVLEAEAAADADTVDIEVSPDGKDFYLTAAEAAALFSETVGGKTTVAQFRRMVMAGEAPAAALQAGGTAKWSQTALDAWLSESRLERESAPDMEPELPAIEESKEPAEPAFRTVYDFYDGIYGPLYEHFDSTPGVMAQRGTKEIRWCRQWWNHESVMMRMTALWQGYEVAYAEGGGAMSTWMLDHADRHFDRIMTEGGPLTECRSDHGNQMVRYPTDPLPAGLNLDAATVTPASTNDPQR